MVKALHQAGIAVVLDVVYNHTCEGDHQRTDLQLQRLRWSELLHADPRNSPIPYANYSGTGNTLNFSHPTSTKDGDGQPSLLAPRDAHRRIPV